MINEKYKYKGFTLIELLVVISIIGLLSTLAVVALKNAQEKARDARRKADLKQLQTALAVYYETYGTYPSTNSYGENSEVGCCNGGWDCSCADQDGDGEYFMEFLKTSGIMAKVPLDPINNNGHHYRYYYYGGSTITYGCQQPFYVLVAIGFEKDVVNYDTVCYTPYVSNSNLVIVGGPNYQ